MDFGPYRTLDTLGEGGMGVVYRAVHRDTGAIVALKAATAGSSRAEALRSEARALARVRDEGVIRILDQGTDAGAPWYAMELLEGGTLEQHLARVWANRPAEGSSASTFALSQPGTPSTIDGLTPPPEPVAARAVRADGGPVANGQLLPVLSLFHRVCRALAALHAQGIVHRDLKPANVFLTRGGQPVIADLGLVSRYRGAFGRESFEVHGQIAGTPHYMAPEQARGLPVDARADLYALGAMLYEALTGATPFEGASSSPLLQRIVHDPPRPLVDRMSGVPPALDALVLRLLEKEPRSRLGYAEDVAAVLAGLGATPDPRPFPRRTYLYRAAPAGRREALESLRGWVDAARQGRGGLVLLHGESGVGKTTLAATAAGRARTQGFVVVGGECLPEQAGTETRMEAGGLPLHPFRGLLLSVADVFRTPNVAAFRPAAVGPLRVLATVAPALLGLPEVAAAPPPPELPPDLAAARVQDALRATLGWWIDRRGPTVLVLDDLQWADEPTIEFLVGLESAWLGRHALLVIGTMRVEEGGAAARRLRERPDAHHLTLGRLDAEAIRAMVQDMLAWEAPTPSLVAELHRMSEGNPFFVAEYLRLAATEGVLERVQGSWRLAADGAARALPEPTSIAELVQARLSGLSEQARAVLAAAAVLGREFDLGQLPSLAGLSEVDLEAAVREVSGRQIVESVEGDTWRFAHDRLRENVYRALPEARRRELHGRAAQVLEQAEGTPHWASVGRHWRAAGEPRRAVDALEKAGEAAQLAFANREALAFFGEVRALAETLPDPPGRLRVARWERALGEASLDVGAVQDGIVHVAAALVRIGEPPLPESPGAQVLQIGGALLRRLAQSWFPGAFRVTDPARATTLSEAAYLYNRLLEPSLMSGRFAFSMLCGLRNLNLADRVAPTPAMARGYGMMAAVVCATPLKGVACRWADVGAAIGERTGVPVAHAYALVRGAVAYLVIGDYVEARARMQRALDIAEEIGARRNADDANLGLATIAWHEGKQDEAVERLRAGYHRGVDRGDIQAKAMLGGLLLLVLALGRTHDDLASLAVDGADLPQLSDTEHQIAHAADALLRLRADDRVGARAAAVALIERCKKAPPVTFVLGPALDAGATVLATLRERAGRDGDVDLPALAREHAQACAVMEGFARMEPHFLPLAQARRALDLHLSGKTRKAESTWRTALEGALRLGQPFPAGVAAAELALRIRPADADALRATATTQLDRAGAGPERARLDG